MKPNKDYWGGFSLWFEIYGSDLEKDLRVKIEDETGCVVYDSSLKMSQLQNNAYHEFRFSAISDSASHIYSIEVSGIDVPEGGGVSLFLTDGEDREASELYVNGERSEYSLKMKLVYENVPIIRSTKIKICILIGFCILGSLLAVFFMGKRLEWNFLLVTVLVSGFCLFFNEFPHTMDEITHYFRSLSISQGEIHDVWNEAHDDIGAYLPQNMEETAKYNIVTDLLGYQEYDEGFSDNRAFTAHHYMSSVIPINHSVAAIGVALGRLFSLPVKWIIFMGRLTTFLFYMILCYFAIKRAQYYKSLYFIVSLLPLGLYVAASFSIDPILVASSLLFIQTSVDYFLDEKKEIVSIRDTVLLIILSVFIVSIKYLVYAPILLLFFLIPKRKFKSRKIYVRVIAIELIVIGILLAWQFYLMKSLPFSEDRRPGQIVDIGLQLRYMLSNPVEALRTIFIFLYKNLLWSVSDFGLFVLHPSMARQVLTLLVFGFACGCPDKYVFKECRSRRKFNGLSLFILISVYMLVVLSLYLGFSAVGERSVVGVQMRYFLPSLIFMMFPLSTVNVQCRIKDWELKLTTIFIVLNMSQSFNVLRLAVKALGK